MTIDIDELERLAMAATPGPWITHLVDDMAVIAGSRDEIASTAPAGFGTDDDVDFGTDVERCEANAAFIAAANPTTILSLTAEVRRLRDADPPKTVTAGVMMVNRLAELTAENSRLRSLLAEAGEALKKFPVFTVQLPKSARMTLYGVVVEDLRAARSVAERIEKEIG